MEKKITKACLLGIMMQNEMSDPFHCIKKLAYDRAKVHKENKILILIFT